MKDAKKKAILTGAAGMAAGVAGTVGATEMIAANTNNTSFFIRKF